MINIERATNTALSGAAYCCPLHIKERDPVREESFDKMIADLIEKEEKKLGVNSEEFQKRHSEIMEMLEDMQTRG